MGGVLERSEQRQRPCRGTKSRAWRVGGRSEHPSSCK